MVKQVSTVQLRKKLSALLAHVVDSDQHVIIEKRGEPLAALVSVDALELMEQKRTTSANSLGALALAGAWGELKDRDMDSLLADVHAGRGGDAGCRTKRKG